MNQFLTIPGELFTDRRLPGCNDHIKACNSNRHAGNKLKKNTEEAICKCIQLCRLKRHTRPVKVHFLWVEPNRRRDLDNIIFAKKYILDALVAMHVLDNDSYQYVRGFSDDFAVDSVNPRVEVTIEEVLGA